MEIIVTVRQPDEILPKLDSSHNYLTSSCNQQVAPKINLNFTKKPLVASIKFYNSFPELYLVFLVCFKV